MDKVVAIAVEPFGLDIVDEELNVWRNPVGLDWTQIEAQNLCAWEFVAHYPDQCQLSIIIFSKHHSATQIIKQRMTESDFFTSRKTLRAETYSQ